MKHINVLSFYELARYMKAVCQEVGLNLVPSDKSYSYVKGKTVYLAPEPAPVDHNKAILNLRRLIHEISHVTETDFDLWNSTPLPEGSILNFLWNGLEDHRCEHVVSKRYQGDADILDAGTSVDMGRALKSAEARNADPIADPEQQDEIDKMIAWLKADRDMRSEWQPSMFEHDITLTPKQAEYHAKIMSHADEIRKARAIEGQPGTHATYQIAKQVFEDLGGDAEQEEKKGEEEKKKGSGKPGEGKPGKDKAEGEAKGGGKDPTEELSLSPDRNREGENPEVTPTKRDPSRRGSYGARGVGAVIPALPQEFYVVNFANPHKGTPGAEATVEGVDTSYYGYVSTSVAKIRAATSSSEQLAQKMRRLVQIKTRSRTQYGLKSGKLHGNSLHRIAANVPGYSERVFKQKTEHLDIDAAACVCLDMSGSMGGDKIIHAIAAAEMLSETVGNALGIPIMLYGFSERGNIMRGGHGASPSIYVLRDFNERQLSTEVLRRRSEVAVSCTMGNNPDGDAVIWGYHQLRQAKGKRKILFVLSDGEPATSRPGDQEAYLKQVCQLIEASPIRLFGLGLEDNSVRHYYSRNSVVENATEIESKIIQLVDNFILEGK